MPSLPQYENIHRANLAQFSRRTQAIYTECIDKVMQSAIGLKVPKGTVFDIRKYPVFQQQLEKILDSFRDDLGANIVNGIRQEWSLANEKNDAWTKVLIGDKKLPDAMKTRFFDKNIPAMNQFIARKEAGMTLSDRVWNSGLQFRQELEVGLQDGITNGKPARKMATEMKQYLGDPQRLFRRVKNEQGKLVLSKAAASYHPGPGKYRSSYKNALRLTRTETNMAYRTADHERWKTMKFVLGFEVKLSGSHVVVDLCDDLKGKYPKDFHFRSWHPQCLCYAVPIRAKEADFDKYLDSIMEGADQDFKFSGEVQGAPQFDNWMKENAEAIDRWKRKPLFIKDNPKFAK